MAQVNSVEKTRNDEQQIPQAEANSEERETVRNIAIIITDEMSRLSLENKPNIKQFAIATIERIKSEAFKKGEGFDNTYFEGIWDKIKNSIDQFYTLRALSEQGFLNEIKIGLNVRDKIQINTPNEANDNLLRSNLQRPSIELGAKDIEAAHFIKQVKEEYKTKIAEGQKNGQEMNGVTIQALSTAQARLNDKINEIAGMFRNKQLTDEEKGAISMLETEEKKITTELIKRGL